MIYRSADGFGLPSAAFYECDSIPGSARDKVTARAFGAFGAMELWRFKATAALRPLSMR
jgi:hypothetical protein